MRRHANRQDCDLRIYDCDRQPSWTPPETLEIDQQPVMRLAVRDQSGRLLGHLFISETGVKTHTISELERSPPIKAPSIGAVNHL